MKRLAIALFLASVGTSANASDYGCTVLLCLSNPAGPKAVSECVPPIDRLFRDLRKGRSFPSCDMATGPGGRSYARQVYDPYDPCPAPLKPAPRGSVVAQGAPNPDARPRGFRNGSHMYQLTARPQVSEPRDNEMRFFGAGPRACVGEPVGQYQVGDYNDNYYTVTVYNEVQWQQAQSPRAIDVFIDDQWYRRVRW